MKHIYLKHLFTALLLLCTTFASAHDFESGGIYYKILSEEAKTVEVTYKGTSYNQYSNEYTGRVVIPETCSGYRVISIGDFAFYDCSGLTSIVIPSSVAWIEEYAFSKCTSLTSIKIPNSVTSFGEYSFSQSGLTSIEIPNSVTFIADDVFWGCTGLTSVGIPNSVTSIGQRAFNSCIGLTSIKIPSSVTSIGQRAFEDCWSLTSVEIGSRVTSIGYGAFQYCQRLTSVISFATKAPNIVGNPFYDISSTAVLKHPVGSDYSSWSGYFANTKELTGSCGANVNWSFGDGVLTISGNGAMDDYPYWGTPWYKYRDEITMVVIEEGVTSIGDYAFESCTGLTRVVIPNSVTSISDYAFYECSGLTNVTIPNSVTCIGGYAFYECSGLTNVTIPNSVTSIGSNAFYGCSRLKAVINFSNLTFSKGSEDYGYVACYADKVYNAPNGFIDGDFIWYENEDGMTLAGYLGNATELALPADYNGKSVTSIGNYAFSGCKVLTSIEIPNSVTSIGVQAFYRCTGLTSAAIGNSVTSIGGSAFYECTGLTSVEIPNSVTSIGSYAFRGCTGLKKVCINDLAAWCGIDFGTSDANPLYYAKNLYLNDELVTEFEIPNSVTSIGGSAFYNCSGITSVIIPNSVTSIGSDAFYGCSRLKAVINFSNLTFSKGSSSYGYIAYYADKVFNAPNGFIDGDFVWFENEGGMVLASYLGDATELTLPADYNGKSVTSIGSYAFYGCTGLTSVVIPSSITSIGGSAFENCTGLTSIEISNSVTSIGSYAFRGCSRLKAVINFSNLTFSKGSSSYGYIAYYADKVFNAPNGFIDGDFVWFENEGGMTLAGYLGNATELALPADYNGKSVTSIGNYAFSGCKVLTSIEIPNSVTSIGVQAFYDCTGLTSVAIGNSVTSIGGSAFYECTGLTSIEIPNSVTSIGSSAFDGCTGLTNVVIGNSVTSIGDYAFYECTGLTSIEIPNSVTSIGSSAFYSCKNLKTVINFSNITFSKGSSSNGYIAYYANKVFNAPNGFIDGDFVWFENEGGMVLASYLGDATELTLSADYNGKSVTSIGSYAFYGCTGLTSVEIPNSVTNIGNYAFYGCTGLTSIEIPNSVTSIGSYAFRGCTGLASVEIPNSVTNIGNYAFYGCTGLTCIEIPNSVTSIGNNAFYGCTALKTVINDSDLDIEKGSTSNGYVAYYADEVITNEFKFELIDGVYTLVKYKGKGVKQEETTTFDSWTSTNKGYDDSTSSYKYKFDATAGSKLSFDWSVSSEANYDKLYVILDGTTVLTKSGEYSGNYEQTFTVAGSHTLEVEYTKDESEDGYNDEAKIYNVKLTKTFYIPADVALPDNYEGESYVIGESAFENNEYVASVTIPEGVEMICDKAFSGCSNLESIVIPNSMSAIGGDAFAGSKWYDNEEDGIVYAGNVLYKYKGSMPENTAITINDGTLGIAGLAFANCTGLTCIEIPASVTNIGNYAFDGCTSLTSITSLIPAEDLFAIDSDVFSGVDKNACTLCVPYGAKETYATTEGWEDFVNIEGPKVTITINQYGSATYCSPFALDFSEVEGLKAYSAIGFNSSTQVVTLARVMTTPAEAGIFVKGEPGEYVVPIIEECNEHTLNLLVGTLEQTTVNSTEGEMSNYKFTVAELDEAPMFYPFEDNTTFSAGKAYLQIPTAWLPATAQKSVSIRFDEGETTGIDELKGENGEVKTIYDLQGRVVENPTSGIYIIDGKKVIIK